MQKARVEKAKPLWWVLRCSEELGEPGRSLLSHHKLELHVTFCVAFQEAEKKDL